MKLQTQKFKFSYALFLFLLVYSLRDVDNVIGIYGTVIVFLLIILTLCLLIFCHDKSQYLSVENEKVLINFDNVVFECPLTEMRKIEIQKDSNCIAIETSKACVTIDLYIFSKRKAKVFVDECNRLITMSQIPAKQE